MNSIEVFEIGTPVWIGKDNKIPGLINGIHITATNGILYKITYWDQGSRKEEWLSTIEFAVEVKPIFKIGFK